MLGRLKLTAMRDRLDGLLDDAARRGLSMPDTLLIQGPPGVGKSHLAVALGREAVRQGYSVLFTSATALVTGLVKGQAEGRLEERLARYASKRGKTCGTQVQH